MTGSREKLGMDLWIGQPMRWGLCRELFFSGAVTLYIIVEDLVKGYHVWGPPVGSIHWAYVYLCGKYMCRVGRVSPCRVYIDLNRRDSQI
jgi:hypothetical protein